MDNNTSIEKVLKDNEIKQITDGIEMTTELVLKDGTSLSDFENRYNSLSKDMTELCIMASKLAQFNRKVFKEYAIDTMGISNATVTVMIKAGDLYQAHEQLKDLPYSKTYELQPVSEQVEDFVETVGGYEILPAYSQAEIRARVKDYINKANETIMDEDETPEDTTPDETPEDTTPDETPEDNTTPTQTEIALKAVSDFLTQYQVGDELETEDISAFKMYAKALTKLIRKEVIFPNE